MTTSYADFLAQKALVHVPTGIEKPEKLHKTLFDFQGDITRWMLKRGRAACFAGTGLGKTLMQAEAARHIERHTKLPVLILAPLAVSYQTIEEAHRLLNLNITFAASQADVGGRGIYITNYGKLHLFDPQAFGGVILDESSCLKSEDAKTRQKLCEDYAQTPFRMAFTATPAPNDFMEIGGHAEFLGVMSTSEMLSTFFVHDGGETQKWRLKGHAEKDFWEWMASWCVCIQHPQDLGYQDERYDLPPLKYHEVIVESEAPGVQGVDIGESGEMFAKMATDLASRRKAKRTSIDKRVEAAARIANSSSEQFNVWCNLNDESEALAEAINGALEIAGKHSDEYKEKHLLGFAKNEFRVMVSKGKIAGWGMNYQNCHNVIKFPDDSFELVFQEIRRNWRFGQTEEVNVYLVFSESERPILDNLKRKEEEAMRMYAELVGHMAEISKANIKASGGRTKLEYNPRKELKLPAWL